MGDEPENLKPNEAEELFLSLAYNRFYDLFEEVMSDSFWDLDARLRFPKVSHGFSVYAELLNYEPLKHVLDSMKTMRPPMEAEIGGEVFKFIRNLFVHFPLFATWDEVWINKTLVNWDNRQVS